MLALLAQVAGGAVPAPIDSVTRRSCPGDDGEIVVCGGRRDRYRLPLPAERESAATREASRPNNGGGLAAITPAGRCGMFAAEHRCGKREAATYGYGEGRDPLSVVGKVAGRLTGRAGE